MIEKSELLSVPVFAGLPDDQIAWFIRHAEELSLHPGVTYWREGDPADAMFVVLEGEIQSRGEVNGETMVGSTKAGEITGLLPFSRLKKFPFGGWATTDGRALRFPANLFPQLVKKMPELANRLVALMAERIREITKVEQQRDRLIALGKISAGLAHEINNPASAAKRATSQLRDTLQRDITASQELGMRELTEDQTNAVEKVESALKQQHDGALDPLAISVLEEQIDSFLRSHGLNDLWQLAANFARKGVKPEQLKPLFATLDRDTARVALVKITASVEASNLLAEIENATTRISDLVRAVKEYTFMDQSPVQNVDIIKSLENTLIILNHELKQGITVVRDYQPVPLLVNSFGSELSQVWTNLINNAIDAMGGKGELRVHTRREGHCVLVEIGDNGPGIPPEIKSHIFDPFFTTKGVGEGTGLGLDIVQRIVLKHKGNIQVCSKPGDTRFQIRLPLINSED